MDGIGWQAVATAFGTLLLFVIAIVLGMVAYWVHRIDSRFDAFAGRYESHCQDTQECRVKREGADARHDQALKDLGKQVDHFRTRRHHE